MAFGLGKPSPGQLDHKCTNLIYVPFILFEGISKSILFNSILNFAILSVFNVRNVIIWHWFGAGARSVYSQQKVWPPPLAHPPVTSNLIICQFLGPMLLEVRTTIAAARAIQTIFHFFMTFIVEHNSYGNKKRRKSSEDNGRCHTWSLL